MMYETAGGTGTAITLSMQPLKQGYNKTFIASANNNGATTIINGKNLYKPGTTTSPKLISGKAYTVWYNSVCDCFFIKASATGTATPAQVLAGVPYSNENETDLVGTLDLSKLISENIKSGVTINGITGHPYVVNTGDAVLDPQFLLTGYSGYDDGIKKNGTMPNLSGNWQTAAFRGNSGNGVLAQIPRGYSDGGTNTYTYCVDSNFIASNIIAGKSIFGLAGTASIQSLGGKGYLSGTFPAQGGNAQRTINLPFKPKIVYVYQTIGSTLYKYLTVRDFMGGIYQAGSDTHASSEITLGDNYFSFFGGIYAFIWEAYE